jgi:hypothetical protein
MRNDALKTIEQGSRGVDTQVRDGNRSIQSAVEASANWRHLIDCYLEGWAEANPIKILHATASGYWFNDPLVGVFSRWSLPRYFEVLQDMLIVAGPLTQSDLAFCLHGPTDQPSNRYELEFWREAPRIGLSGVTRIRFGEHGVVGETVAYDLNLASHLLRRTVEGCGS